MSDPNQNQQQNQNQQKGQQQQQKGGGNQAAKSMSVVIGVTPDDCLNRPVLANNFTLLAFGALGLLAIAHAAPWIHKLLFRVDPEKSGPPPVTVNSIKGFLFNCNPGERAGVLSSLMKSAREEDKPALLELVKQATAVEKKS